MVHVIFKAILFLSLIGLSYASPEVELKAFLQEHDFKCVNNECSFKNQDADVVYYFNKNGVNIVAISDQTNTFALADYCNVAFDKYLLDSDSEKMAEILLNRIDNKDQYLEDNLIFYSRAIGNVYISVGKFNAAINNSAHVICYIKEL